MIDRREMSVRWVNTPWIPPCARSRECKGSPLVKGEH